MITLRQKLKQHTLPAHKRLETHPRIRSYTTGEGPREAYRTVLRHFYRFWSANPPAEQRLSSDFHEFYKVYTDALARDADEPTYTGPRTPRHEVAFFYVLLGSSLGARYMLRKHRANDFPLSNLEVMSEHGNRLWQRFNRQYLSARRTNDESRILTEGEQLFNALYQQLQRI